MESFAVENTQPLQRFPIPPKATKEVIWLDQIKAVALNIFSKNKRSSTTRKPSTITTASQGIPTTVTMTGIPNSSLDHSVAIIEIPANQVEYKVGSHVNLLDIYDDIIVAIARIISI